MMGASTSTVLHEDGKAQHRRCEGVVLSEGQKDQISLNSFRFCLPGAGSFQMRRETVIGVTITMPKHKPEQARFVLD